jgi:UDP-N-acetylglucosamine 2-epimerase (non-hydrolysing)
MKILTVAGTRPEVIRLSRIVPLLDEMADHMFVHAGQNATPELRDVFFEELGLRDPDVQMVPEGATFAHRVGSLLGPFDDLLTEHAPDRVVVLGDTDSGLTAFVAARRGIPVCHLEAGNRAYDDAVPEEVNRRLIDHASTLLLPYTERSADNLVREGIPRQHIIVVGNPIGEVLTAQRTGIEASAVRGRLGLPERYFLLTVHRAETTDDPVCLREVLDAITTAGGENDVPVVFPAHPRTVDRLSAAGLAVDSDRFVVTPPLGFFDFVRLESDAALVLTDSGTVQEECALLATPCVVVRDVTERPELVECGAVVLGGRTTTSIVRATRVALSLPPSSTVPEEYRVPDVAARVARVVLGAPPARP